MTEDDCCCCDEDYKEQFCKDDEEGEIRIVAKVYDRQKARKRTRGPYRKSKL